MSGGAIESDASLGSCRRGGGAPQCPAIERGREKIGEVPADKGDGKYAKNAGVQCVTTAGAPARKSAMIAPKDYGSSATQWALAEFARTQPRQDRYFSELQDSAIQSTSS